MDFGFGVCFKLLKYSNYTKLNSPALDFLATYIHDVTLTELERICRKEWEKLPKYRCAKLVASYPRRLAAKGASAKYE